MRDVSGYGCDKNGVPLRPEESIEHPNSGLPLHDMIGGNAWISYILASLDPNGPVYDPTNVQILEQGPDILTLDRSLLLGLTLLVVRSSKHWVHYEGLK